MKQRDEYIVDAKVHNPRAINLICDATFYGKRKDKFGTLVFKDNEFKEILVWKFNITQKVNLKTKQKTSEDDNKFKIPKGGKEMAFRIRNNYEADVGLTNLYMNRTKLSQLEQQLSTGLRIVRAADDATDLFIADYLKHTYVGLQRGTQNAQYGLAAARVVDDALGRIYDILVKIKDKIVEAANAHTEEERKQAQQQINEYVRNIAQIVKQTEFDGKRLLRGDVYEVHYGSHANQILVMNVDSTGAIVDGKGLTISAIAGTSGTDKAIIGFNNSRIFGLDILGASAFTGSEATSSVFAQKSDGVYELTLAVTAVTIQVSSKLSTIERSLEGVEKLITSIDQIRGYYAGIENKLQNIIENNQVMIDNLKEGESVVRNVDYASAFAEFQKMRVITQANVAALAQANQIPQLVLQLLR
jgi:flagellin